MKALSPLIVFSLLAACTGQPANQPTHDEKSDTAQTVKAGFDSVLSARLGADRYGMKQYVMAFLKRGPNRGQDSATAAQLQKAHLENINRMAAEGKLAVAGPFLDDWEVRGIYIFNTATVDTASAWTATDPAIQAGRLVMELHPWYGSAALMQVNEIHGKLEKKNVAE